MARFNTDLAIEPTYLDISDIGSGYGILSIPIDGFLPGDDIQTLTLTIAPRSGSGATITKSIDMVQRTDGYFEYVTEAAVSAHFTLTAADLIAIAAGTYGYSASGYVLRSGSTLIREIQAGNLAARPAAVTPPIIVATLPITGGPITHTVGATTQLTATPKDAYGNTIVGLVITWSSSNAMVAQVDQSGLVTAVSPGTAVITAAAQGVSTTLSALINDPHFISPADGQVPMYDSGLGYWTPGDVATPADLAAEVAAREAADDTLQDHIDAEASTRASADSALTSALSSEASTRATADTTLQTHIDTEASTRAAADSALSSALATETANRISGDAATLASADAYADGIVATESAARVAGDTGTLYEWGQNPATTAALNYGHRGGRGFDANGVITNVAAGVVALTNNATNYVERTIAGVVSANTAGFTTSKLRMAVVTTSGGTIAGVADWRVTELAYYPPVTGEVGAVDFRFPVGNIYRYGAIGNGVADDTTAWANWNLTLVAINVGKARAGGTFLVMSNMMFGSSSQSAVTNAVDFDYTTVNSGFASDDPVLTIDGISEFTAVGFFAVNGYAPGGRSTYANRQNMDIVSILGGNRVKWDTMIAGGAKRYGIRNSVTAPDNTNMWDIAFLRAAQCGTGRDSGNKVESVFTSNTQSGGSKSASQRSLLGFDSPSDIPGALAIDDLLTISSLPYLVTNIDTGAGTVEVYPCVPSAVTTGTVRWAAGAGIYFSGNDSNIWNIHCLDVTQCSTAMRMRSLYPPAIVMSQMSDCSFGYGWAKGPDHSCVGGAIVNAYFEGNVDLQFVKCTQSNISATLGNSGTATLSKLYALRPNSKTDYADTTGTPLDIFLERSGVHLSRGVSTQDFDGTKASPSLAPYPVAIKQYLADIFAATLTNPPDYNRLFGYDTIHVYAHGSGANAQPTGTWTFKAEVGYTVNGGATAVFTGFAAPEFFICKLNVATLAWTVTRFQSALASVSADIGDADATLLVAERNHQTVVWNSPLTAPRAAALSTTHAYNGAYIDIVRTAAATGASPLNVGTGPLIALAPGQWARAQYNGSAWILVAAGRLAPDTFGSFTVAGQYSSVEYPVNSGNPIVGGTATIDWDNGNVQYAIQGAATAFSFINQKPGGRYVLILAGGFTPTLPASVRYADGNLTPSWTATAGRKDIVSLIYSGVESLFSATVALNILTT